MPRRNHVPKYSHHKASGRAYVRIAGQCVYLGPYDSPESHQEYRRLIAEHLATGGQPRIRAGVSVTVAGLVDRYLIHAKQYYAPNSKQFHRVQRSLQFVLDLYVDTLAMEFSPLRLKAVRAEIVRRGWKRGYVNKCVGCIVRCWKWGVSEELLPANVYEALRTVEGLKIGRTEAPESEPVRPVPTKDLEAVRAIAGKVLLAMIDVQLWSAMRPGELVKLRPCDIDRSGRVDLGNGEITLADTWIYSPAKHKTQHHGHRRIILFGPQAQTALAPFLFREPEAFCFTPLEAAQIRTGRNDYRPGRKLNPFYTVRAYHQAIQYVCARAECKSWSPNRLRHNAASRVKKEFGWDVTRIILGHSTVDTTTIYVEEDLQEAAEAVRKSG